MSLALHQLRHEFRRSRVFVAVFWIILLGNFSVAAGWIGQPEYQPLYQGWGSQSILPGLLSLAFWVALALLVTTTVAADSPSNRERFLAIRPLPPRALLIAKALFILLAMLLPCTLVEFLSLRTIGAPAGITIIGAIEHFGLLAIFTSFVALFTSHWKSVFTTMLALGLTIGLASGVIALLTVILTALTDGRFKYNLPEPTMLTAAIATAAVALGLVLTLRLHIRRQWKVPHHILPFAGLSFLWFVLAVWCPLRSFSLPGTDQAAVSQTLNAKPDPISFAPQRIQNHTANNLPARTYRVAPSVSAYPGDWEIRWHPELTTWFQDGSAVHRYQPRGRWITRKPVYQNSHLSPALMNALQDHTGGFRLLVSTSSHPAQPTREIDAGQFYYPSAATPSGTMHVEAAITASAARWSLAANLPVTAGSPDWIGPWRLAGVHRDQNELEIFLAHRTPKFHTVSNPSLAASPYGWTGNAFFALHFPDRNMVWIADSHYNRWSGSFSSAAQTFGELSFRRSFSDGPELQPADLASARLLIFQAEHLGEVTRSFRSPDFTLHPDSKAGDAVLAVLQRPHEPESSPAALAGWIHQHQDLPANLPADQLRAHLDELFNLERRANAYVAYPHSPATRHLARFVPHHRDLLLDAIRGMDNETQASRLVVRALTQAATDDDKPAIIAALADTPILIRLVIDRGWIAESRAAIIRILESYPYKLDPFLTLASLDDPELDPLLLASYERFPSVRAYNTLSAIPRLQDQVDDITTRAWSPDVIVMNRLLGDNLELALTQGRPEALAHLYDILPYLDEHGSDTWTTADIVSRVIALPDDIRNHRHDDARLLDWLRQHQPADFRFDPVLRRFVLTNSNPS